MLWSYFQKGGWVMYPLLVFSAVALGLILERLNFFVRLRVNLHRWFEDLQKDPPSRRSFEKGLVSLKGHPLKKILRSLWDHRDSEKSELESIAQEESEAQLQNLERNLKPLSVIALLSPLVGLLGTVLGIMKAFQKTQDAGQVDPTQLAGGIWEALITTFVGLAIAIPAWAFYYYFSSRVDRQVFLLEFYSSRFLRWLKKNEKQRSGEAA